MKALQTISSLPTTKAEIKTFVEGAKVEILSGDVNPLDVAIQLKAMETLIKELQKDKDIKDYMLDEAYKHDKTFEFKGSKMQIKNAVRYDYSVDTTWKDLKKVEDLHASARRGRELFLKGVKEESADPTTGEVILPIPSTSSEIISITLK